jgi:SAM-dependent methyltransferase
VSPRPAQAAIAESYSDPHFYDEWLRQDPGREIVWRRRFALTRRFAPRGTVRLLDVGAGIGAFLALARDVAGWQIEGTEVSDSAVRIARERHGVNLRGGQLEEIDLPLASCDVVTLWHVLEHVPSPMTTLRRCHELLRPGGVLMIAVPNDDDWGYLIRNLRRRASHRYPAPTPGEEVHLSHFRLPVVRRALERAGFSLLGSGVDDFYGRRTWRTGALIAGLRGLHALTGWNWSYAMWLAARRDL